jgi:hypothetical protein
MSVQHARAGLLPLTWEIPTTVGLAWLVLAVCGLPAGQAVAYILPGRRGSWPVDLPGARAGLLRG